MEITSKNIEKLENYLNIILEVIEDAEKKNFTKSAIDSYKGCLSGIELSLKAFGLTHIVDVDSPTPRHMITSLEF